jgi:hypothetical protein
MRSLVLEGWSSICLEVARDPLLAGCGSLCGFDGRVTRFGAKPKGSGKSPAATFAFLLRTDQGAGTRACPPKPAAAGSRSDCSRQNPVRGSLPGVSWIFRAERKPRAQFACARGAERLSRYFVLGSVRWSDQKRNAGMVEAARSATLAIGAISKVPGDGRSSRGWQRSRRSVTRVSSNRFLPNVEVATLRYRDAKPSCNHAICDRCCEHIRRTRIIQLCQLTAKTHRERKCAVSVVRVCLLAWGS